MKGFRKSLNSKPSDQLRSFDIEKNLRVYSEATSLELSLLIATILGELDFSLTEKTAGSAEKEKATWNAVSAAERALLYTRNLKYFSRLNQNAPQIFDLSQLILDTVEFSDTELSYLGIRPKVFVETNLFFQGDPGSVEQIVLNLLELVKKNLKENSEFEISLRFQQNISLHFNFKISGPLQDQSLSLLLIRSLADNMGAELNIKETDATFNLDFIFPQVAPQKELQDFTEARRHRRIRLTLPATLQFSRIKKPIASEITLLSMGGCFAVLGLGADFIPETNEALTVRVDYFQNCSFEIAKARVASLCAAGEKSGIGIEFQELSSHAQKLVRALVKSHT